MEGPAGRWGTEVGKRRRINLADGTFVTETITEVLGDRGFRYTLTDFSNTFGKLAYGIYGEWIAEPLDGGTLLHWTWTYPAKPGLHFALKLIMDPLRAAYHRRTLRLMAQGLQTDHS